MLSSKWWLFGWEVSQLEVRCPFASKVWLLQDEGSYLLWLGAGIPLKVWLLQAEGVLGSSVDVRRRAQ